MIYKKKVVQVPAQPTVEHHVVERPVVIERDRNWWWEGSAPALIIGALALVGLIVYFALRNREPEAPIIVDQPAVIRTETTPAAQPPIVVTPPPAITPPATAPPVQMAPPVQRETVIIERPPANDAGGAGSGTDTGRGNGTGSGVGGTGGGSSNDLGSTGGGQ